ncbi:hypothetical protein DL98DRAFT_119505 [Cadophora sp. DSE1049]|nr:hypothetical protein DL98DRAFT_119505 [Cadophora sp. DSE1049]
MERWISIACSARLVCVLYAVVLFLYGAWSSTDTMKGSFIGARGFFSSPCYLGMNGSGLTDRLIVCYLCNKNSPSRHSAMRREI